MSTEDQAAVDHAAELAGFSGSYDDAAKQPTATPVVEPVKAAPEAKQEEKVATEPVVESDPMKLVLERLDRFEKGHTTLAGQFGRIQQTTKEISEQLATAKAAANNVSDAPTQAEIKKAATDPKEWGTLKEQYPEWALATEKLVESRMPQSFDDKSFEAKIKQEIQGQTAAVRREIVDSALDAVYPGWKQEVNTPEFKAWFEKNSIKDSENVGDVVKMLKQYDASKVAVVATPKPTEAEPSSREKRLAASVNPKGAGGNNATGASEQDAMNAAYSG